MDATVNQRSTARAGARSPVFAEPRHIVRPTFPPLESFQTSFAEALRTGQVTNNGPHVREFERRLTEYLGVPTLVFSSGQAALMTMLLASGLDGGEVIATAFTFPGTLHAITLAGATPVFADISDDGSFTLDPRDVARKVTDRTVAILSVDPYGIASDYAALDDLGRRRGVKVLYDSAPAFGTRVDGALVGGFGDAQIFSFHATKAFNTMEGGALASHDTALIEAARAIRNFGLEPSGDASHVGINGKMTEICALIGIEQLKVFERAASVRRRAADRIRAGLEGTQGLTIGRAPPNQSPIWLYLPVLVDPAFGLDRDEVADALARENLFVRRYYSPACHQLSVYAGPPVSLPHTERAAARVLALPIYNDMTDFECDGAIEAFRRVREEVPPTQKVRTS
jgi:dTDP-4-amino-4,6-dideoxygalactose transaminase